MTPVGGGGGARAPCKEPMFPPPLPNLFGWFGYNNETWSEPYIPGPATNARIAESRRRGWSDVIPDVAIIDLLEVPDVPVGDYVLQVSARSRTFVPSYRRSDVEGVLRAAQYRYDSEQTPQVWNSCADLRIVAA